MKDRAIPHPPEGGDQVDARVRTAMERRTGMDLGHARVHFGEAAARESRAIGARAFTYGSDIFLGSAAAQTDTHLLAHELTHVVQQRDRATPQRLAEVTGAHDSAEVQAEAVANEVSREVGEATIVEDAPTRAGQLSRNAFMQELKQLITDATAQELGPSWTVAGCPYIQAFFVQHQATDANGLEQLAKHYSGVQNASSAADYYGPILARVRGAVRRWRNGDDISADLSAVGMSASAPTVRDSAATRFERRSGIVQRLSEGSGSSANDRPLDEAAPNAAGRQPDPASLTAQLGAGAPLPSATRARMEQGLGHRLSHVRLHTGDTAARLATSVGARAFTVGGDVAFGAGQYRPGTLEGDLILAHELAHTIQQGPYAGAGGAREPAGLDETPLEHVADLTALHAVASIRGVRIGGLPTPRLAPGRAGLRLQGCKDTTHKLDPVAIGPMPDYDKFTTPDGKIIDTEESAIALASMVQNPDQLDRVWSDAQSGHARAKAVIDRLTPEWINVGSLVAEREGRVQCLAPPTQVVTELLDDESCFTDWSKLDMFHADRPGGANVRELIALGYSKRARELHIRNNIIIGSLNLLLAGWTVKSALAGEARALQVEAAPPGRPRPKAPRPSRRSSRRSRRPQRSRRV